MTPAQIAYINAATIERDSYKKRNPSAFGRLNSLRHPAKQPYDNPGYCKCCELPFQRLSLSHANKHNFVTRQEMIAAGKFTPIKFGKILDKEVHKKC